MKASASEYTLYVGILMSEQTAQHMALRIYKWQMKCITCTSKTSQKHPAFLLYASVQYDLQWMPPHSCTPMQCAHLCDQAAATKHHHHKLVPTPSWLTLLGSHTIDVVRGESKITHNLIQNLCMYASFTKVYLEVDFGIFRPFKGFPRSRSLQ